MNNILEHILSIPKSFYVSSKYFPLKDAVKLPIMVRYNTVLLGLKGKISNSGGKICYVESRFWQCGSV